MADLNSLLSLQNVAIAVGAIIVFYYFYKGPSNDPQQSGHGHPKPQPAEKLQRLPVGNLTLDELAKFDGKNQSRILVSVCGRIFDLTKGRDFYGTDGPYNCFTGADASYMLGAMSLDVAHRNKKDFEKDGDHQITLSDWISRYRAKYPIVGRLAGYKHLCPDSWREAGNEDIIDDNIIVNDIYSNDFKMITVSQLAQTAKYDNDNSWISVCGIVFSIKSAEIVYESLYADFPGAMGNDISVALATNDFKEEAYNKPILALGNDKPKLAKLKKYLKSFVESYPIVGFLHDDAAEAQGKKYRLNSVGDLSQEWDIVDEKEVEVQAEAQEEQEQPSNDTQ